MRSPIILSAPLTFSDWVLKKDNPPFSPEGVRIMLERCKAYGFTRVYWRCYDAGRSTYESHAIEPMVYADVDKENMYNDETLAETFAMEAEMKAKYWACDYRGLDTLSYAIGYGHEMGLEVHAWATINEDDHGGGWPSRFSREHPQYHWVNRDGRVYRSQLSFSFEPVRRYKLELIKEMLAYDIDGLFLDWARSGDIRDCIQGDADGVADYGYEEPNIREFRRRYGIDPHCVSNGDPRWVSVRAEPITKFMRECRMLVNAHSKKLPLSVMGYSSWGFRGVLPGMSNYEKYKTMGGHKVDGCLRGQLLDISTWAGEGLIDEAVPAGYYLGGGNPVNAFRELVKITQGRITPWTYEWVPEYAGDMARCLQNAEEAGAGQILFWEADYVDNIPKEDLAKIIGLVQEARNEGRIR